MVSEAVLILSGVAAQVDAVLPQTQCTRCGYPDCAHYAQAVSLQQAGIDQCPPGGVEGVRRIAAVMQVPPKLLNSEFGVESPRTLASIDENWCIGCTLCLDACPVDAIVGASKRMHTVVAEHCTGCELCIPVCPVDCIELVPAGDGNATGWVAWSPAQADNARMRHVQYQKRQRLSAKHAAETEDAVSGASSSRADVKKEAIRLALAKSRNAAAVDW